MPKSRILVLTPIIHRSVDDDSITLLDAILLHDQPKNVSWLENCGLESDRAVIGQKQRGFDTLPSICAVHVRNRYLRSPNGMKGYLSPSPKLKLTSSLNDVFVSTIEGRTIDC